MAPGPNHPAVGLCFAHWLRRALKGALALWCSTLSSAWGFVGPGNEVILAEEPLFGIQTAGHFGILGRTGSSRVTLHDASAHTFFPRVHSATTKTVSQTNLIV